MADQERDVNGHFISKSDSDQNPDNHTVQYGSDQTKPKTAAKTETAKEFAERGVVERHGEAIRQNPDFDNLVKREMEQVSANQKATEGM